MKTHTVTVNLTDKQAEQLEKEAKRFRRTPGEIVAALLGLAFDGVPVSDTTILNELEVQEEERDARPSKRKAA